MTIVDEQAVKQAVWIGAALADSVGAMADLKLEQAG